MAVAARLLAATGALYCALAVALGAYAAHGATVDARPRLDTAMLYLFLHGLALVAMREQWRGKWRVAVGSVLAIAVLLFAGSLVAAALFGWSSRMAPIGGTLLIVGWLGWALLQLATRLPPSADDRNESC